MLAMSADVVKKDGTIHVKQFKWRSYRNDHRAQPQIRTQHMLAAISLSAEYWSPTGSNSTV